MNENLQILSTGGSELAIYIFIRMGARRETKEIKEELLELKKDVKSIDQRLSRLEGKFDERGYWQSHIFFKTGTEDKK